MAHAITGPCSLCGERSVGKDVFGQGWCEKHAIRIEIAAYGKQTNWRAVHLHPYGAIAEGAGYWRLALAIGKEDLLQAVYAAIQQVMATATPDVHTIEQKGA